jgi:hypothetical protein
VNTTIPFLGYAFIIIYYKQASLNFLCMERDLPNPNASVCSRTRQLAHLPITFNPQDRIDTAHASVLNRNVETDVLGAPYIHMCIERA